MFTIFTAEAELTRSLSTSEADLIEYLAELSAHDWRVISTHISWYHRKGYGDTSMFNESVTDFIPYIENAEDWRVIRQKVNAMRKSIYKAKLGEKKTRQKDKRRNYMRDYMAMYRRRLSR